MKIETRKSISNNELMLSLFIAFPQYFGKWAYEKATEKKFVRNPSHLIKVEQNKSIEQSDFMSIVKILILDNIINKIEENTELKIKLTGSLSYLSKIALANRTIAILDNNTGAINFSTTLVFASKKENKPITMRDLASIRSLVREAAEHVMIDSKIEYYTKLNNNKIEEIKRNIETNKKYKKKLAKLKKNQAA